MADPMKFFEAGNTKQFTATFSATPFSTPVFTVWAGSGMGTLVHSAVAVSSDATHWYAFYTMPNTPQFMVRTWTASFLAGGPVVNRELFRVVFTWPG
jgi:hypothetical protein